MKFWYHDTTGKLITSQLDLKHLQNIRVIYGSIKSSDSQDSQDEASSKKNTYLPYTYLPYTYFIGRYNSYGLANVFKIVD